MSNEDSPEPINLEALHGARLVWTDSDGNERSTDTLTCGQERCDVCGGTTDDEPALEVEKQDDFTIDTESYKVTPT